MPTLAELVSQAERYSQDSKPDLSALVAQAEQYEPKDEMSSLMASMAETDRTPTTMPDMAGGFKPVDPKAPAEIPETGQLDPVRLAKRFAASAVNYGVSGIKSMGTSMAEGFRAEMGDPLAQEDKTPNERLKIGLEDAKKPTVDVGPPEGFWDKVADTGGAFAPMILEQAALNAVMPGAGLAKTLKAGGRLAKLGAAALNTARSSGAFAAQTSIREDEPKAIAEGAGMGAVFGAIEQIPGASIPAKLGKTVLESIAMERAAAYHGGDENDRLVAFLTPWGIKATSKAGKVIADGLFRGQEIKPSRTGLGDPGKPAAEREAIVEAIEAAKEAADPQSPISQKLRVRMQVDPQGQATLTPATDLPPQPTPRARAKELGIKVAGLSDDAVLKRLAEAEAKMTPAEPPTLLSPEGDLMTGPVKPAGPAPDAIPAPPRSPEAVLPPETPPVAPGAKSGGPEPTRGELANPAQTTETRQEVMKIDETRQRAPVRTDEAVEVEARQMLDSDYEGSKQRIIKAGESGGQLNDRETVAAREIITREGIKALSSGDDAAIGEFRKVVEAYRNTGTAQAEAFRSRRDQIESPAGKLAGAIAEAAFSPSKAISKALKAASTPEQRAKVEGQWTAEIKRVRDVLSKNGIDLAMVFGPGASKAATTKEPTWLAKKGKKARQELVDELDDFGKFLQGRAFSTPLDPEILIRTTRFVSKAVKAGALSFVEFAEYAAGKMGRETVQKLEPYLMEAWKTVKAERDAQPKKPAQKRLFKSSSRKSMDEPVQLDEVFAKQDIRNDVDPAAAIRVLKVIQTSKSDPWDATYEYWRNAILSAPTTHAANVVGNTAHTAWHYTAERMVEAAVNTVARQKDAAQWGEFKYILGGALPGISKGYRDLLRTMRDEVVIGDRTKIEDTDLSISGTKGRIVRTPQTALLAEDAFATAWIGNMEAPAQAYRIGKGKGLKGDDLKQFIAQEVENRHSESWKRAIKVQNELTFKGKPGPIGQQALLARKNIPGARYFLPFITTPSAILRTGLTKSPLGSVKLAADVFKATQTGDWSKIPKGVAQQVIAWGATAAVMGLMSNDDPMITGASTPSRQFGERTMAQRTMPLQSIRLPFTDTWVSYSRLEPFATTLGIIVDSVNAWSNKGAEQVPQATWESIRNQISSKTFLTGIGDIIEAFDSGQGSEDKLARWASSFAVSWVPNILRSTGRAAQEKYPERGVWGKGVEWWERLGKRTVQKLELGIYDDVPSVDIWGRTAPRSAMTNAPMTDFVFRMLLPTTTKKEDVFIGDRVLMSWNRLNPDNPKYPGIPAKYYRDRSGVNKYMTDDEYYQYLTIAGKVTSSILMSTPLNDENPTEKDINKIEDAISTGRDKAKQMLFKTKK